MASTIKKKGKDSFIQVIKGKLIKFSNIDRK